MGVHEWPGDGLARGGRVETPRERKEKFGNRAALESSQVLVEMCVFKVPLKEPQTLPTVLPPLAYKALLTRQIRQLVQDCLDRPGGHGVRGWGPEGRSQGEVARSGGASLAGAERLWGGRTSRLAGEGQGAREKISDTVVGLGRTCSIESCGANPEAH